MSHDHTPKASGAQSNSSPKLYEGVKEEQILIVRPSFHRFTTLLSADDIASFCLIPLCSIAKTGRFNNRDFSGTVTKIGMDIFGFGFGGTSLAPRTRLRLDP